MTRYINLCREPPKPPPDDEKAITKYEKYKDNYQEYRNQEHRKDFQHKYNKNYRIKHSFLVECECGTVHKDISRYAHIKSQKHIRFYQKQNNDKKQDE